MITFTIQVTETKPGTCAADMALDVPPDAADMEHQMSKALDCGIRQTLMLVAQKAKGGEIIEGNEIEQFVKAALERATR